MYKEWKYRPKKNLSKLTYTQICTYKKTERFNGRIEQPLKELISLICKERGIDFSEATRLLWINYLSKVGEIEGYEIIKKIYGINWEL